jgi:hypothetical protein
MILTLVSIAVLSMLGTFAVTQWKKNLPDWVITTFIVPAAGGLVTFIQYVASSPGISWPVMLLASLNGVFLYELIKNAKNALIAKVSGEPVPKISDPAKK